MPYIEILVEEPSAEEALKILIPKIFPAITFRIHPHSGKDDLLRKLPGRLRGYKKIPGDFRIVVLIDLDGKNCQAIKQSLDKIAREAGLITKTARRNGRFQVLNRIAIEELEAWFFGDLAAIATAYPGVSTTLNKKASFRDPDAIRGGTWEKLEKILQKEGYFPEGLQKVRVASEIACHMDPVCNQSRSFQAFVSGLKSLVEQTT